MLKSKLQKILQKAYQNKHPGPGVLSIQNLLKNFLNSPAIKKLKSTDNVSLGDLDKFATLQGKKRSSIVSATFLKSDHVLSVLFSEWIESEKKSHSSEMQSESSEAQKVIVNLQELPDSIQQYLLFFLNEKETALTASTCSFFRNETQAAYFWQDKLIEAGCKQELLEKLIENDVITNYKHLYHVFMCLSTSRRKNINELWELCALSGDIKALEFAVEHYHLTKDSKGYLNTNALHYTALSGDINGINFIAGLGIDTQSEDDDGYNPLFYATLGGSSLAIDHCHDNLEIKKIKTDIKTTLAHMAALSGYVSVLEHVHTKFPTLKSNDLNDDKEHLLHFSFARAHRNMSSYIINKLSQDPNQYLDVHGENCLFQLLATDNVDELIYAIDTLKLNFRAKNAKGESLLHAATKVGATNIMRHLIQQRGFDPQEKTKAGLNILHLLARGGFVSGMKFCIDEIKILPSEKTSTGSTILHLTAASDNPEAVGYVYEINQRLKLGMTAEQFNQQNQNAYYFASKSKNPKEMQKALDTPMQEELSFSSSFVMR